MKQVYSTVDAYLGSLTEERKAAIQKLRTVIKKNLPAGFEEQISYGMIGYVVPHTLYPAGYHCAPELPLPFMNIASQKNFIAIYHMGIYADNALMDWFTAEYAKHVNTKLDMGKSCIRCKNTAQIPYELIGELATKYTPEQWIGLYEKLYKRK